MRFRHLLLWRTSETTWSPHMTFQEECESLAPLETFDPGAFIADERSPQDLCNFVLAVAAIYNDCKDAIYAHVLLQGSKPEGAFRTSRKWGTYYGISGRISRLIVSHF